VEFTLSLFPTVILSEAKDLKAKDEILWSLFSLRMTPGKGPTMTENVATTL